MDKKKVMLSAFNYLPSDLLYGTYLGVTVKQYLEMKCDAIIRDDWTPDMAAFRIKEAMVDRETQEPLYSSASKNAVNPLGSIIGTTQADKIRFIKEFISKLPYKGNIKTSKNTSINIEEELNNLLPQMQDDYTITNVATGQSRTLKDYYGIILSNEFVPPTKMDKIELVMYAKRQLMETYESFDEELFQNIAVATIDMIDDNLEINIEGKIIQVTDYINSEYKRLSIDLFNSVNSKPTNVELINLQYDENNKLSATNEYIFMSDEETKNLSDSLENAKDLSDKNELHQTMLDVLDGIYMAKSVDTLSSYHDKITVIREQIKNYYTQDKLLTNLYSTIITEYAKKEDELDIYESNLDDSEILLRNELQDIKNTVEEIRMDYLHTYEDVDDRLESVKYDFNKFKLKAEEMGLSMHHEIDEVYNLIKAVDMKIQYSKENISHLSKRNKTELDALESEVLAQHRNLMHATTPIEQATIEIKLQNSTQELTKKLEDYLKNGSISYEEYEVYLNDINTLDMDENKQRR